MLYNIHVYVYKQYLKNKDGNNKGVKAPRRYYVNMNLHMNNN